MVRKVFNTAKVVMIARFRDELTMLEPLTEEQMKELTRNQMSEKFIFTTSSGKDIHKRDIHLFGDIDFENETDLKFLSRYKNKILNKDSNMNFLYSTFDYDKGTIESNPKKDTADFHVFMKYQTYTKWLDWFKYNYCLIGKPKYCLIYAVPNRLHYDNCDKTI